MSDHTPEPFVIVDGRTVRLIPSIEVAPRIGDTLVFYDGESAAVLTADGALRGFAMATAFGVPLGALSVDVLAAWVQGAADIAESRRTVLRMGRTTTLGEADPDALAQLVHERAIDRYGCANHTPEAYAAGASVAWFGDIRPPFVGPTTDTDTDLRARRDGHTFGCTLARKDQAGPWGERLSDAQAAGRAKGEATKRYGDNAQAIRAFMYGASEGWCGKSTNPAFTR